MRKITYTLLSFLFFYFFAASSLAASFNYGEALQKSIFFYDEQRNGRIESASGIMANRVYWRGNSFLGDYTLPNTEGLIDLGGGFADAGDNIKFNFPMAGSMTLLAWGLLEFKSAYDKTGQTNALLANLRWGTDYLLKCWDAQKGRLWGQVSPDSVQAAHGNLWMPYEVVDQGAADKNLPRYGFYVDANHPGTDLAGETVAAFTAASLVFQSSDAAYAAKLLSAAKAIYSQMVNVSKKGKYSDNLGRVFNGTWKLADIASFYTSWSGYDDEIAWSSMWLYRATNDASYIPIAEAAITYGNTVATLSWDDKSYGAYLLMAKWLPDSDANKAKALQSAQGWLNAWSKGDASHVFSKDGLAIATALAPWGNARYAASTAFGALIYDLYFNTTLYNNFAKSQIDYLLGNNSKNFSYMIGFGANFPRQPHHATAEGRWSGNNDVSYAGDNRHILYGGLVGGPKDINDSYQDLRNDYVGNEVALDYNAGFVGALAGLVSQYGGSPLPSSQFPPTAATEHPPLDEIFVNGTVQSQQQGSSQSQIQVSLLATNHSAWPARVTSNLKIRYFINIADKPASAALPSVHFYSTDSRAVTQGPTVYDASQGIYYIEVWFKNIPIYPGGDERQISSKETQIQITYPWSHDFSKDWSYSGLSAQGQYQEAPNVPIYTVNNDGSATLLFGKEPGSIPQGTLTLNFSSPPTQCLGATDGLILSSGNRPSFKISNTPFSYTMAVGGPYTVQLLSSNTPISVAGGVCQGKLNASTVSIPGSLTASYTYTPVAMGTLKLSTSGASDSRCNAATDQLYLDGSSSGISFTTGTGLSKTLTTGSHALALASSSSPIPAGGGQPGVCAGTLSSSTANIVQNMTTAVLLTYRYQTTPGFSCTITEAKVTQQLDWGRPTLVNAFNIQVALNGYQLGSTLTSSFVMKNPFVQNFWGNFQMTPSYNGANGSFTGVLWQNTFTLGGYITNDSPLALGDNPLVSMVLNGVTCNRQLSLFY